MDPLLWGLLHLCVPPLLYACTRVSGSVWVPQSMNVQWAVRKPIDEACLGIRGQQVTGLIKRGSPLQVITLTCSV